MSFDHTFQQPSTIPNMTISLIVCAVGVWCELNGAPIFGMLVVIVGGQSIITKLLGIRDNNRRLLCL